MFELCHLVAQLNLVDVRFVEFLTEFVVNELRVVSYLDHVAQFFFGAAGTGTAPVIVALDVRPAVFDRKLRGLIVPRLVAVLNDRVLRDMLKHLGIKVLPIGNTIQGWLHWLVVIPGEADLAGRREDGLFVVVCA